MDKRVPEVRFKGFTDDWEQHQLGELVNKLYNGQTPSRSNKENWNGNINWLSSGELNHGLITKTIERITSSGQKQANLHLIPSGTFIMAITGLEAAGTRGNCAILGIETTLNQSCMALFPINEKLTVPFLFQWYLKYGEQYGIEYTQGTKQQSYNAEIIKILPISIPSIKAQKRITSLLDTMDKLITLQQDKILLYTKLKQSILEKLFPSYSKKSPDMRFNDFNKNWEQRKHLITDRIEK
ncbi:restriction endonuclease subunit S [Companilactobacillus jidongensis]|uniref:restriction endonuclease subunit S n=1 Tax=Companilactobacillus jidongensis TaxID=2486006 RepID=UPI000F76ED02|nr:restriction endonuclease subunit S [Companilactobacillus jidongensis]